MEDESSRIRTPWIWKAALVCFIIAGATGSLMRFGMLYGYPAGLQFVNVRHAHSHLMYFGWVTPALMALIAANLPRVTGRQVSPRIRWVARLRRIPSVWVPGCRVWRTTPTPLGDGGNA